MTINETLIQLEKELHNSLTRSNQARLDELIADDFYEFGSSGNTWTKADILNRLPQEKQTNTLQILSKNFVVKELSPDIYFLTYVSYRDNNGQVERAALRSSLWRKKGMQWEMIFHQGTFKN
jgi:hypothetical protein